MTAVDLYWLPLGAGGHVVRFNGIVYERLSAWFTHRTPVPLYHCALRITVPPNVYSIEMTPVWQHKEPDRGVVAEGPVGAHWAGRSKYFRYEVHCWRNGPVDDIEEAVESPLRLSADSAVAEQILDEIRTVPTFVWGRDAVGVGDMWNSNSVVAWVLTRCGVDLSGIEPPRGGRAPGWHAGIAAAARPSRRT